MKTKLFVYALLLFAVIGLVSCNDDDDDNSNSNMVTFVSTLTGAKEVPVNASTATGTANFTYDN